MSPEHVKRRRFCHWPGQSPSKTEHAAQNHQLDYKIPAGAYSTQGIPAGSSMPQRLNEQSHATSQTNQGPFPPRPVPIPPPQGQISQARPSALNLATWTSYSGLDTSVGNLISHATQKAHATVLDLETLIFQCVGGAPNVHEPTSRLLDQVITSIDSGVFCGRENELGMY